MAVAIKMIEQSNPRTLPEAMQWLASFSERNDVVSRMGLTTLEEVPMEIAALQPPASVPSQSHDQLLSNVLRGQEHIYTTKIDGVVCPPNISETVAGRLIKLAHRQRIASTTIKLISKTITVRLAILVKTIKRIVADPGFLHGVNVKC